VTVRVRAPARDALSVRLNGVPIGPDFGQARRGGVRRLKVSASHGLRHGANVLRVRLRPRRGKSRSKIVRFTVRRGRPLAGAGRDRQIPRGTRIRLNGSRSRIHPAAARKHAKLRYHWTIAQAPKASARAAAPRARPRLGARSTAKPTFRARLPGRYVLRLRVTAPDGRTGRDLMTLKVDPPPALFVDTMAKDANGKWGIRLGGTVYPADPGAYLQLLVLDRSLGTVRDNKPFPCPDESDNKWLGCASAVRTYLGNLRADSLVIASNQPENGGTAAAPLGASFALESIRVANDPFPANYPNLVRGTYSAIGVPRSNLAGVGNTPVANAVGAGEITGFLVRNNILKYDFVSSDRVAVDTQAPGSNEKQNVITIGAAKYTADVSSAQGGFHVVIADDRTLQASSQWFATGQSTGQAAVNVIDNLKNTLTAAANDGHKLVFITTRGNPTLAIDFYGGLTHEVYHRIRDLVTAIERLGGTRNRAYAVLENDFYNMNSYTLVGQSRLGAGHGDETLGTGAGIDAGSLNTAPLEGNLRRTTSGYAFAVDDTENSIPGGGAEAAGPGDHLLGAVFQAPTPWPDAGDKGRQAAIAYLGDQAGLGTDPRGLYWTQPWGTSGEGPTFWNAKQALIDKLQPTDLPAGVSQADFAWAKRELVQEITWLEAEHAYIESLAAPYQGTQLKSWADLQLIADQVNTQVKASGANKTEAITSDIFDLVRELTAVIPKVGEAFEAINQIYDFALELAETLSDEPAGEPFSTTVAKTGKDLIDRLDAAYDMLTIRYANVIAADYGKLRRVGTCGALDKQCPDDTAEWQITSDEQTAIGLGLRGGLKSEFYAALLPAKYTLWAIPDHDNNRDARKWVGQGALDVGEFYPFDAEPDLGQLAKPDCIVTDDPTVHNQWQVFALGARSGSGTVTDPYKMELPTADLTNAVFGASTDGFPDAGGLGNNVEVFFDRYFAPKPMQDPDAFPLRDSRMFWFPPAGEGDC
jgi:hypothetical protein